MWAFVRSLELEELYYAAIDVSGSTAGRPAIATEVLVGLWLLATLDGIGSAREMDRRCETDIPYMWLRGHVAVNYHTLSDFRGGQAAFLERLLVNSDAAWPRTRSAMFGQGVQQHGRVQVQALRGLGPMPRQQGFQPAQPPLKDVLLGIEPGHAGFQFRFPIGGRSSRPGRNLPIDSSAMISGR